MMSNVIYICFIHSLLSGVSLPLPCRAGYVIHDSLLAAEVMQYQTKQEDIVMNDESRRFCAEVIMFCINYYVDLHLDQLV